MQDFIEQATKVVEKAWEPWKQMMNEPPWLGKPDLSFLERWTPWFETIRANYDVNISAWNSVMARNEELFFKMLEGSPLYSESLESQIRQIWEAAKSAQRTQQDLFKENLKKIENLLKEAGPTD